MPLAVAALGGPDLRSAPVALGRLVGLGWDLVVTQGPPTDTESGVGLLQGLANVLRETNLARSVASVLTQVVVDPVTPGKPPLEIVEVKPIRALVESGVVVFAAGGAGIPVVREHGGRLRNVDAVVDKDRTSSLLARLLGADLLILFGEAAEVIFEAGSPDAQPLRRLSVGEARTLLAAGRFRADTMAPRVEAAAAFTAATGRPAILTSPERILDALVGTSGTVVRP